MIPFEKIYIWQPMHGYLLTFSDGVLSHLQEITFTNPYRLAEHMDHMATLARSTKGIEKKYVWHDGYNGKPRKGTTWKSYIRRK